MQAVTEHASLDSKLSEQRYNSTATAGAAGGSASCSSKLIVSHSHTHTAIRSIADTASLLTHDSATFKAGSSMLQTNEFQTVYKGSCVHLCVAVIEISIVWLSCETSKLNVIPIFSAWCGYVLALSFQAVKAQCEISMEQITNERTISKQQKRILQQCQVL
jgi:hypothetical protein